MILRKKYNIELYGNYKLHVVIADTIREGRDSCNKEIGHECDDLNYVDGMHSFNKHDHGSYIFLLPHTYISTISHEAFHATNRIMNSIGAELNNGSEESYAYLLGYIVDKCMDTIKLFLNKQNN